MKSFENPLKKDLEYIINNAQDLWEKLRGQRIFITGGTGFIGSWILESLVWADQKYDLGIEAILLTRNPDAFKAKVPHIASYPSIQLYRGNVLDFIFPPSEFKYIIHAAADPHSRSIRDQQLTTFDTIVEGTRRTLQFAQQCGAEKFLLMSSGAVYGCQPPDILLLPEDFPGVLDCSDPDSAYGEGKRAAETLSVLVSSKAGFEVKIARCFTFLGAYLPLDAEFAVGNFIRDGLNGEPIQVLGDGTAYRSFLYASDMVIWLWTILFRGKPSHPYNVGSELPITIVDLARLVADQFGSKPVVQVAKSPITGYLPERYIPSTRRAMSELGLHQSIDLTTALQRTISFYASKQLSRKT